MQDKEIHILLEDQQKINQFARLNNRLEEFKDDMKSKKTEIQTLEDAGTDMMMLEDDDEKIPYQIGEVFVEMTQDEVQETLDKTKETLEEEVTKLEEKANEIKSQMSDSGNCYIFFTVILKDYMDAPKLNTLLALCASKNSNEFFQQLSFLLASELRHLLTSF